MHTIGFTSGLSLDEAIEWEHEHALDREDDDEPRPGWWELASLIVLVVAGTGLPLLGWLVAMGMVHLSDVWTERDKTIAVIAPAAVVGAVVIAAGAFGPQGTPVLTLGPLAVLVLFGGAIAGFLGAGYLAWRCFRYN